MPDKHAQLALELLRLFPFMHFDGIDPAIFKLAREEPERLKNDVFEKCVLVQMMPSGWDPVTWGKAIAILVAFSLVSISKDNCISLHPLVHDWSRERLTAEERKQAWEIAAITLGMSITCTYTFEDAQQRRFVLPHIDAVLLHDQGGFLAGNCHVAEHSVAAQKFMMAYDEGGRRVTVSAVYLHP